MVLGTVLLPIGMFSSKFFCYQLLFWVLFYWSEAPSFQSVRWDFKRWDIFVFQELLSIKVHISSMINVTTFRYFFLWIGVGLVTSLYENLWKAKKNQATINITPHSIAFAGSFFEYVGLFHVWAQSDDWHIALTIFVCNSNLMTISFCYNSIPCHQITTKFCTCHDSIAVMSCAKF